MTKCKDWGKTGPNQYVLKVREANYVSSEMGRRIPKGENETMGLRDLEEDRGKGKKVREIKKKKKVPRIDILT